MKIKIRSQASFCLDDGEREIAKMLKT